MRWNINNSIFIEYAGKVTDDLEGNVVFKERVSEKNLFPTIDELVKKLKENVNDYFDDAKPEIV